MRDGFTPRSVSRHSFADACRRSRRPPSATMAARAGRAGSRRSRRSRAAGPPPRCGGRRGVRRWAADRRRPLPAASARSAPWRRRAAGRRRRPPRSAPVAARRRRRPARRLLGPELHRLHGHRIVRFDHVHKRTRRAALHRSSRITGWSRIVSSSSWTVTNWFGNSTSSGLSNIARSLTVPVVVSIWLSTVSRLPAASRVGAGPVERGHRERRAGTHPLHYRRQIVAPAG